MEKKSLPLSGGRGVFMGRQQRKNSTVDTIRIEKGIRKQESKQENRQQIFTESRILREAHRCAERDKENGMTGYSERVFPCIAFVLNLTLFYLPVAAVYSASILL